MDGLAGQAATAYLTGWALSGGPLTDATAPGCTAAVLAAIEHAASPDVLETTLVIGKLDGAWALVFDRREKLTAKQTAAVMAAWRAIVKSLGASEAVHLFRTHQAAGTSDKEAAAAAAAAWLSGILVADGYQALQDAVADAIRAGMAEGKAGALAVAAEQHPDATATFSFTAAYKSFYDGLAGSPGPAALAQSWIQKIIAAAAADLARLLMKLHGEGTPDDAMASAVKRKAGSRAVRTLMDWAIGAAMASAALSLFRDAGTETVSWVTAGDGAVCPACQSEEDGSPYPVDDVDSPPLHPFCRCVLVPNAQLPLSLFAPFLQAA